MEEIEHCLEAAHLVIDAVAQKVSRNSVGEQKLIKSSIALMLYLIAKLDTVKFSQNASEDFNQGGEMKDRALKRIHLLLSNWMRSGIGSRFGMRDSPELELKVLIIKNPTCGLAVQNK